MKNLLELPGNPGDIAIQNVNITQNPRPDFGQGHFCYRTLTVRRLDTSGKWEVIGHITEHFGDDPEAPEGSMFFGPNPNGSMYSEPWFTEEEREIEFRVVTRSPLRDFYFDTTINPLIFGNMSWKPESIPTLPLVSKDGSRKPLKVYPKVIEYGGYYLSMDHSRKVLTVQIPESEKVFTITETDKKVDILVENGEHHRSSLSIEKKDD